MNVLQISHELSEYNTRLFQAMERSGDKIDVKSFPAPINAAIYILDNYIDPRDLDLLVIDVRLIQTPAIQFPPNDQVAFATPYGELGIPVVALYGRGQEDTAEAIIYPARRGMTIEKGPMPPSVEQIAETIVPTINDMVKSWNEECGHDQKIKSSPFLLPYKRPATQVPGGAQILAFKPR